MKFFFKQALRMSAFYLEKKKFYIYKQYDLSHSLYIGQYTFNRWRFYDPILNDGFGLEVPVLLLEYFHDFVKLFHIRKSAGKTSQSRQLIQRHVFSCYI